MTIETYPEMNTKIVDILRWDEDAPMLLYAAQRIEELEAEVEWLQTELESRTRLRQCKVCKAMIVDPQPAPDAMPSDQQRGAICEDGERTYWCTEWCAKEATGD